MVCTRLKHDPQTRCHGVPSLTEARKLGLYRGVGEKGERGERENERERKKRR
jgi:hypothetical protein